MIINNEIYTEYKIKKEPEFHLISSDIRKNIKNYNKKEDDRRKQYKN